ncbi:hypothetical protein [Salimicrobium halophilum]|uniref:Uncharacterized protein n=1 Tax=Salimicrobium halophilum TaxID=86666 RepID=A0A1G8WCM2_9BACI|nr:hypothetical protein [Salimicrobium halophilum]SDJ75906.1 hypothetical protein SAMN04490247_3111 [Salimicrobium halophilum]
MGFKQWFVEGTKDHMKPKVELNIIAGSEKLNAKFPQGFDKTNMFKEKENGVVKIFVPGNDNIRADLKDIVWEKDAERSGGKAAAGAIGGGLVLGPLGAIGGAAVGGRKKDTSSAFLYLQPHEEDEDMVLHVECDKKMYQQISKWRA